MTHAYIFDAIRTPRGKGNHTGALYTQRPVDIFSFILKQLIEKNPIPLTAIEEVIAGCVTQTGEQGGCIARFAALQAGFSEATPAMTVNRFCGSGLQAIGQAASLIQAGYGDLVVAGGVESMSRVSMGLDGGTIWDASTQWKIPFIPQGISADLLATLHQISRDEVDSYALESHRRAAFARENKFYKSAIPFYSSTKDLILDYDELIRPNTSKDKLSALAPSFEAMGKLFSIDVLAKDRYPTVEHIHHIHTAGNSSGIADGAAAVLLGSSRAKETHELKPKARIRSFAACGSEPVAMLTGPIPATKLALKKAGMQIQDVDLFEVNEAFAVVPILYSRHFNIDPERINVYGGAIALGHPLGATGAMLLGTMLDALEQKNYSIGLVTLCIGGGMGIAAIIEKI